MKNGKVPDPNAIHPIAGYSKEIYVKPTLHNPNIVVGNPAKPIRKRFDDELIELLLLFKWWDKTVEEINALIPILTCSDLEIVRKELTARLQG